MRHTGSDCSAAHVFLFFEKDSKSIPCSSPARPTRTHHGLDHFETRQQPSIALLRLLLPDVDRGGCDPLHVSRSKGGATRWYANSRHHHGMLLPCPRHSAEEAPTSARRGARAGPRCPSLLPVAPSAAAPVPVGGYCAYAVGWVDCDAAVPFVGLGHTKIPNFNTLMIALEVGSSRTGVRYCFGTTNRLRLFASALPTRHIRPESTHK